MKSFINNKRFTLLIAAAFIITTGLAFTSCKKEYIDKYNIVPGDTILVSGLTSIISFNVKEYSADTVLKAAITEEDTIIVYWPANKLPPEQIAPEILLPEKTTISPASGAAVDFADGTTYIVKAEDGTEKNYTLKVINGQLPFYFTHDPGSYRKGENRSFALTGPCYPVKEITTVNLETLDSSAVYPVEINMVTSHGISCYIPSDTPNGQYRFKVSNGIYRDQYARQENNIITVRN